MLGEERCRKIGGIYAQKGYHNDNNHIGENRMAVDKLTAPVE